jgi:hypothetical protein
MIHAQGTKLIALEPAATTAASTTTLQIDRLGYDYVEIDVTLGSVSNASNVPTAIFLSESDDTNASNFATITGSSQTANITALPTTGVTIATWDVTCVSARKRYLKVNVSPQANQVLGGIAILSRAEALPVTTTDRNIAAWVVL